MNKKQDPKFAAVDNAGQRLVTRLKDLQRMLRAHDSETSGRLPSDDEEAAPIKSAMDVIESAEKAEMPEASKSRETQGAESQLPQQQEL